MNILLNHLFYREYLDDCITIKGQISNHSILRENCYLISEAAFEGLAAGSHNNGGAIDFYNPIGTLSIISSSFFADRAYDTYEANGGAIYALCKTYSFDQSKCTSCLCNWKGQSMFVDSSDSIKLTETGIYQCASQVLPGPFYSAYLCHGNLNVNGFNATRNYVYEYGSGFACENCPDAVIQRANILTTVGRNSFYVCSPENSQSTTKYCNFIKNEVSTPGVFMFSGQNICENCIFSGNTGNLVSISWDPQGFLKMISCTFDIPPTSSAFIETQNCIIDQNATAKNWK